MELTVSKILKFDAKEYKQSEVEIRIPFLIILNTESIHIIGKISYFGLPPPPPTNF